jgi:hypothetical protein
MAKPNILIMAFILSMPLILISCYWPSDPEPPNKKLGLVPVYGSAVSLNEIKMLPPKQLESPGKIFVHNNYLLVNEVHKGVHIIDNSYQTAPVALAFLSIPGNMDVVMRGNSLIADFHDGLVSIDISNPTEAKVLSYVPGVLSPSRIKPMLTDSTRFMVYQCPDTTKGVVIGWKKDTVYFEKCYNTVF